jgi:hypothetical protein
LSFPSPSHGAGNWTQVFAHGVLPLESHPSYLQTWEHPTSASSVLGWQMNTTIPGSFFRVCVDRVSLWPWSYHLPASASPSAGITGICLQAWLVSI